MHNDKISNIKTKVWKRATSFF